MKLSDTLRDMWNNIKITIILSMLSSISITAIISNFKHLDRTGIMIFSMEFGMFGVLSIVFYFFAFNQYVMILKEVKNNDGRKN